LRRHARLTGRIGAALVGAVVLLAAAVAQPGPSATSGDGRWTMVAPSGGPGLALFDPQGRLQREWRVATLDGRQPSRVAAIRASASRQSFVIALLDLPELWEISLDPQAAPIYDGLVHDYRMGEGLATPGYLGVRRSPLDAPLADIRLAPSGRLVLGRAQAAAAGSETLEVIHLDVRRRIARLPLDGPADLDRLAWVEHCGRRWLVVPSGQAGAAQWFDAATWVKRTAPPAPAEPCPPPGQPPG